MTKTYTHAVYAYNATGGVVSALHTNNPADWVRNFERRYHLVEVVAGPYVSELVNHYWTSPKRAA